MGIFMDGRDFQGQSALMEQQIQSLQKRLASAEEMLSKTESNRNEYKSKYFQFKGIFQRQTYIFYQYQSLSCASREALGGIFKGNSFEEFLACGVQPGNIDALWEFSRIQALDGNTEELATLGQMIVYFVSLYNKTSESPLLAFQEVSPGDIFDVDLHIRTRESKASGTVSKILLNGLANAFTGEVIKKAIVEVN